MVMLPGAEPITISGFLVGGEPSTNPDLPTVAPDLPTVAPAPITGRQTQRVAVEMDATLRRRSASGVSVDVLDLSTTGFRVASHLGLMDGDDVWLRLASLEPLHARVVWTSGYMMGCRFVRPLHPAVLEMIITKAKTG